MSDLLSLLDLYRHATTPESVDLFEKDILELFGRRSSFSRDEVSLVVLLGLCACPAVYDSRSAMVDAADDIADIWLAARGKK